MAELESIIGELLSLQREGKALTRSSYPESMYLPSKIHETLRRLSGYTTPKKGWFSFGEKRKRSGTSGNEFAVQYIYFIDTLYAGPNVRGNSSSVSLKDTVSLTSNQDGDTVRFTVKIGSVERKTKAYSASEVRDPLFSYGISFHTHPKMYLQDGDSVYGFFSNTDIFALLGGSAPLIGLVVGNKLWIAGKTKESKAIPQKLLAEATRIEYISRGFDEVQSYVKNSLRDFGIVFYFGNVTGKLRKL